MSLAKVTKLHVHMYSIHYSSVEQQICVLVLPGYSGADMANLCREAALGPIRSVPFDQIEHITADQVSQSSVITSLCCNILYVGRMNSVQKFKFHWWVNLHAHRDQ